MAETLPEVACRRCGQIMESGYTTALGLIGSPSRQGGPRLVFVVPGEGTAGNPFRAFQQGLEGVPGNRAYLVQGYRCPGCGAVELMAREEISWIP